MYRGRRNQRNRPTEEDRYFQGGQRGQFDQYQQFEQQGQFTDFQPQRSYGNFQQEAYPPQYE